jgi:hypothetical protein
MAQSLFCHKAVVHVEVTPVPAEYAAHLLREQLGMEGKADADEPETAVQVWDPDEPEVTLYPVSHVTTQLESPVFLPLHVDTERPSSVDGVGHADATQLLELSEYPS